MGQRAQQVVGRNQGAAARTVDGVFDTIPQLAVQVQNNASGIVAKVA